MRAVKLQKTCLTKDLKMLKTHIFSDFFEIDVSVFVKSFFFKSVPLMVTKMDGRLHHVGKGVRTGGVRW